jgi:SepF-like predicted cell division protein (DUF552 family)
MIKLIQAENPQDFEELVNEFESNNQVFATQTHIRAKEGSYTAVMFFRPKGSVLK